MHFGRPSIYTEALADTILEKLSNGLSLVSICSDEGLPALTTVYRWLTEDDKKSFRDRYAIAREIQAEIMVEEIIQIADDGRNDTQILENEDGSTYTKVDFDHINRSRLRVDARKWVASKLKPKKYGDFNRTELSGNVGGAPAVQIYLPQKKQVPIKKTKKAPNSTRAKT